MPNNGPWRSHLFGQCTIQSLSLTLILNCVRQNYFTLQQRIDSNVCQSATNQSFLDPHFVSKQSLIISFCFALLCCILIFATALSFIQPGERCFRSLTNTASLHCKLQGHFQSEIEQLAKIVWFQQCPSPRLHEHAYSITLFPSLYNVHCTPYVRIPSPFYIFSLLGIYTSMVLLICLKLHPHMCSVNPFFLISQGTFVTRSSFSDFKDVH